jgi:hypothetical protein
MAHERGAREAADAMPDGRARRGTNLAASCGTMARNVNRRAKHKLPGRFCWCCGRRRANEGFSRKQRVCSHCAKLGQEEIAYRRHVRDIDRLLNGNGLVERSQRRTFERYLGHPDARVRAYAERVKAYDEERRQELRAEWAAIRAGEDAAEEAMLASLERAERDAAEAGFEEASATAGGLDDIPF